MTEAAMTTTTTKSLKNSWRVALMAGVVATASVLSGAALMATGLPPLLDNWQTHASYLVKLTEITGSG